MEIRKNGRVTEPHDKKILINSKIVTHMLFKWFKRKYLKFF